MLILADKDFKTATITMAKETKDVRLKKLKEHLMIMFHQIENVNKEVKAI